MTRSNIQHDVVQLLDKYKIAEILDVVADIASNDVVNEMRKWFDQNFGDKRDVGDDLDEDLANSIINTVMHEIDHINMRLVKLERGQAPSKSSVQTTGNVPKEIIDIFKDLKIPLSEEDMRRVARHLRTTEKTDEQKK